jgi:hypothetical protein
VNRETLVAARLDPNSFVPGYRVTDSRLRSGRRHYDRIATYASSRDQGGKAWSVNAVVIG